MPTFFLFCHLSFDVRGLVGPDESHACLSPAGLLIPRKTRANHFSIGVWACMEGLRPQEGGRPHIAAMHAGMLAGHWSLGMQSKHHYGLRKSAHTSPARTAGQPAHFKAREGETRAKDNSNICEQSMAGLLRLRLFGNAAHSGDRSSCTLREVGAVVPQNGTNDMLAVSSGTLAWLPAVSLFLFAAML